MTNEHMFGGAPGHLPARADEIAKAHNATLVNYTDAACNCGFGCDPHTCRRSRRHWFATPNRGEPFNSSTARKVYDALRAAGLVDEEGHPATRTRRRRSV